MAADCEEDLEIPHEESPLLRDGVEPKISFEEWYRNEYRNRGESQCQVVWRAGHLYYKCFTCALHPRSAICYSCFNLGDHEGHIFAWVVSEDDGFCDCGDPAFWRESGFCASNLRHPRLCCLAHEYEEEHLESTVDGDARFHASSKSSSLSTTCYYSARTQSMIENRSNFMSNVEFEIEYSKVHWSEMDPTPDIEDFRELNHSFFCHSRTSIHQGTMEASSWKGMILSLVRKLVKVVKQRSMKLVKIMW